MDVFERVIGIVVVVSGLLGGPAGYVLGRRQRAAETGRTEAEGGKASAEALALIRQVYGDIVGDLVKRVDLLEDENVALRGRVAELEGMLAARDARILHLEELVAALQN